MHYAACVAGDEIVEPEIDWVPGSEHHALMVKGKEISVSALGSLVRRMTKRATAFLEKKVLQGCDPQQLPRPLASSHTKDDLSNQLVGYSFVMDDNNKLKEHRSALIRHFVGNPNQSELYVRGFSEGTIIWNKSALTNWLKEAATLAEYLLTLLHLAAGQPARATELSRFQIVNTTSSPRNVYFCMGTIMLVQRYRKQRNASGYDRAIARFLPKNTAELLYKYLVVVKPMERYVG